MCMRGPTLNTEGNRWSLERIDQRQQAVDVAECQGIRLMEEQKQGFRRVQNEVAVQQLVDRRKVKLGFAQRETDE